MLRTGDQVDADGTVGNAIADGADVISRKGDPTFVGKTGLGTAALDLVIDGSASIGSEQIYSAQIIDERIAFRQHRLGRQRISEPKPRVVTDHDRHRADDAKIRNVPGGKMVSDRVVPHLSRGAAVDTHAELVGVGSDSYADDTVAFNQKSLTQLHRVRISGRVIAQEGDASFVVGECAVEHFDVSHVRSRCRHSISRNVRRLTLRSARKTPKTLERAIAHGTTRTQMIHASETGIGSAAPIAIESQPADVCRRTYHA